MFERKKFREGGSSLAAYFLGIALLAAATLTSIPAIVSASSLELWGSLATGQAIGAITSAVVSWGWGVSGPALIAAGSKEEQGAEFRSSLRVRLLLCLFVLIPIAALTFFVVPGSGYLALQGCLQTGLVSLASAWFFVGQNRPWALLWLETLPRVAFVALAILLMGVGASANIGATVITSGVATAATVSTVYILRNNRLTGEMLAQKPALADLFRAKRFSLLTGLSSAAYSYLPIILVSAVSPGSIGYFGLLDKVQKQASTALAPFVNLLQGWVPRSSPKNLKGRIKLGLMASGGGSIILMALIIAFGQDVIWLLSARTTRYDFIDILLLAIVIIFALNEAVIVRVCLVSVGGMASALRGVGIGASVGLAAVIALGYNFDATGALSGVAIGLLVMIILELIFLRSLTKYM